MLGRAARRGGANAEFVRRIGEDGGQVLLDARTRRGGSHQKLVVVRPPGSPGRDVAFIGGIDLGHSRNDDSRHPGDPQVMEFPGSYGPRPPWHDIQAEVRGPAVHDLEHTFRERWYDSTRRGPHAVQVCAPTRPGSAGTPSRRSASGASPTRTAKRWRGHAGLRARQGRGGR